MQDTETRLELSDDDRVNLADALDHAQDFLGHIGLEPEVETAASLQEAVLDSEVIVVSDPTAARAFASLYTYREHLLDEGDVALAAEIEETTRIVADQMKDDYGEMIE